MSTSKFPVYLLLFCALNAARGQQSDLFTKAPPDVDEALRARVNIFYNAHVTGKFSDAFQVVADDSKDIFLGGSRDQYQSCEIFKINYSENFTKADVVTGCKGDFRAHGLRMAVTMPMQSSWKSVNGQWYWFAIKRDKVPTPFGTSSITPDSGGSTEAPIIPADPMAVARDIL